MKEIIIQLLSAAAGSVAFGLVFNVRRKYLPLIAALGAVCWGVWLHVDAVFLGEPFIPALASGLITAILVEIFSRILRAPSTIFFLTSTIPLIPGGTLYNFMAAMVEAKKAEAFQYGTRALYISLGIAVGMCIAWAICDFLRKMRARVTN